MDNDDGSVVSDDEDEGDFAEDDDDGVMVRASGMLCYAHRSQRSLMA